MSEFAKAVMDALNTLDSRHYGDSPVVIYTHPKTLQAAQSDLEDLHPFSGGPKVYDCPIEATSNVPENVVMATRLDAARRGSDAIAYAMVGGE